MIKYQPSTSTKKISLKGKEIITGGSIIMPMDMSTEATTISMIKKGTNTKKPISKARVLRTPYSVMDQVSTPYPDPPRMIDSGSTGWRFASKAAN